jgi:hypothetical protein
MKKSLVSYVVKGKLEDGTIVELKKDCDCITHDGPHWIYMDCLDRTITKENIKNDSVNIHSELIRLDNKKRLMKQHGIIELILPFPYDDPRWSYFTYRQTTSERTKEQKEYDEWLENYINKK